MALSYRAAPAFTNSGSVSVTSFAVTKQAGTAAGDWIFIYMFAGTATMACTGFTAKPDSSGFGGLLYRLADGTEGASFTVTGLAGNRCSAMIVTVAGATATLDPATVATPASGGPATSVTVPGVTLANAGDWLLWFCADQNGYGGAGYAITPPAGFTSQGTSGALTSNATIMLADDQTTVTGATGTQTGTFGGSAYFSGVLAGITPASAGPATAAAAALASGAATAARATASTPGAAAAPATLAAATAAAAAAGAITSPVTFPGTGPNPLGVKIELLLAGTWTDITSYVMLRNPVTIAGMGRADWTSTLQAATLTLTLNNRDGRFTPKLAAGAYFPNITRNCQIRVGVTSTSVTGLAYSGFRFWGEVAAWPVAWDVSESDIYADVTASGIWRRMSQLQTTLGSAYTRYNAITLTGTGQPRCYWPCEDGAGSGQLVAYDSVAGTGNAIQTFITGAAGLSLGACTDFKGSDGIPQLNAAMITATVPAGGTPTVNCTRFLLSVPAAGDSAQGTTPGNIAEIDSAGTVAKFEVYLNPAAQGTLLMHLVNSGGAIIASGTTTTVVKGKPVLVSCELTPSGGNVAFAMRIITQGAAGITESLTGTLTSATVGQVSAVKFGRAQVLADTAVGHCSVTYGGVPPMVPAAYALGGYAGEFALDRFNRVCSEMGIAAENIGAASSSAAMGPQVDGTLTAVLQSIEDTDMGLLYESRARFGLGYRTLASMANQAAAAVISYTANRVDPSLAPAFDDSLTRNNVTVTNWTGYTQQAILTAGPMSVLNPPNGIGNGYADTRTVNAAADTQIAGIAGWLLNTGGVDEVRFPVITMMMARRENAPLFTAIPGLRPGDYLQITSPPAFLTAATIRQLTFGYTETLGAREWTFAFNTVPESPYETGFSAGTAQTAQLPGSGAVTSTAPGAGGLGGLLLNGSVTPAMLSEGITVTTLGGNRNTIAAAAPATPNVNDIWINSGTGLISSWNGTAWVPYQFDASQTIQAGTIVAANIAASTIDASLIAAGTVVAGIVNATDVLANTYIATNAGGEFLAYDTTSPATGHLINAVTGAAGTDSAGNPYPAGSFSQQLTLPSLGSAPPPFTGSSVLYTSAAGRLRYLSSAGADLVLDRSALNLTNFTMTTQTTPHVMSGALSYLAGEAIVGSEYEVEIDGTVTSPAVTAVQFTFDLFLDGAALNAGSAIVVGAVVMQTGNTYAYTLRARATVQTTGAGGTVNCALDGGMTRKVSGVGNTSQFTTLNNVVVNCAFDTTASHALAIYCNWGGSPTSGSAITYRTKITRRY